MSALPEADIERIRPLLSVSSFLIGDVLYEPGQPYENIYFPTTAIMSLINITRNGATAEIGLSGRDGMLGHTIILGGEATTSRAMVQRSGDALRMSAADMRSELERGGAFHNLMLRYTQYLMTQISQTAVCNRLHTIKQQCCRWILITHDRVETDRLEMTHELLARMLGVRREGVTIALQHLSAEGCCTRNAA